MSDREIVQPVRGVFSITKQVKIGTGTTARKTEQTAYYYAEQDEAGRIHLQPLNTEGLPFGAKKPVSLDKLLQDFSPEPEKYLNEVLPKMREVQKAVARGDKFRKRGETFTAEFEYSKALQIDEQNVRANFGIGLCYLERGDKEKAHDVFERLVKLEAAFGEEHKHLFNEFGIKLRKSKLYGEAEEYYRRALEISPEEENLYYNLARALYEKEDYMGAAAQLVACLKINPDHVEALKFMTFLRKNNLV